MRAPAIFLKSTSSGSRGRGNVPRMLDRVHILDGVGELGHASGRRPPCRAVSDAQKSDVSRSGSSSPRSSSHFGQRSHTRRVQRAYIETVALALAINTAVHNEFRVLEGTPRRWQCSQAVDPCRDEAKVMASRGVLPCLRERATPRLDPASHVLSRIPVLPWMTLVYRQDHEVEFKSKLVSGPSGGSRRHPCFWGG